MLDTPPFIKHFWEFTSKHESQGLLALSPDRSKLAFHSDRGRLQLWDLSALCLFSQSFDGGNTPIEFLQFFEDNQRLLIFANSEFRVLNLALELLWSWKPQIGTPFYFDGVSSVLCHQASRLASSVFDGVLRIELFSKKHWPILEPNAFSPSWYQKRAMTRHNRFWQHQGQLGAFHFYLAFYHAATESVLLRDSLAWMTAPLVAEGGVPSTLRLFSLSGSLSFKDLLHQYPGPCFREMQFQIPLQQLPSLLENSDLEIPVAFHSQLINCLAISPAQDWLVAESEGVILIWDLIEGTLVRNFATLDGQGKPLDCERLLFLDDEHFLSQHLLSYHSVVHIWRADPPANIKAFKPFSELATVNLPSVFKHFSAEPYFQSIQKVLLSQDQSLGVTLSRAPSTQRDALFTIQSKPDSLKLQVWKLETKQEVLSLPGDSVSCFALSDDHRWLVLAKFSDSLESRFAQEDFPVRDESIELWDLDTGVLCQTHHLLVTGYQAGDCFGTVTYPNCQNLYFLDSEQFLSEHGGRFILWSTDASEPLSDPDGLFRHQAKLCSQQPQSVHQASATQTSHELKNLYQAKSATMRLSKDASHLFAVYAFNHQHLHLWMLDPSKRKAEAFQGYAKNIHCIDLSQNDKWLISGGEEICIWRLKDFRLTWCFEIESPCKQLLFLDKKHFVSRHLNGTFKFWKLGKSNWLLTGWCDTDGRQLILTPEGYFKANSLKTMMHYQEQILQCTGSRSQGLQKVFFKQYYFPKLVDDRIQQFFSALKHQD